MRGADSEEPARAGQNGRSSPAVVAADPRWRQLADVTPDYNEPETLAESEAAALPVGMGRRPTSIRKAAPTSGVWGVPLMQILLRRAMPFPPASRAGSILIGGGSR
jgi:hypothetical protein